MPRKEVKKLHRHFSINMRDRRFDTTYCMRSIPFGTGTEEDRKVDCMNCLKALLKEAREDQHEHSKRVSMLALKLSNERKGWW